MAKIDKKNYWKFLRILLLVTDRGMVEILWLHRKGKNEKMEKIVLFQIRLRRELCFWKCKILLHLRVLEFRPQEKKKKCKQNFKKNLDFLAFFYVICISKGTCEVSLWQRCTHQVSLETICPRKVFVVIYLFNFLCKKCFETLYSMIIYSPS